MATPRLSAPSSMRLWSEETDEATLKSTPQESSIAIMLKHHLLSQDKHSTSLGLSSAPRPRIQSHLLRLQSGAAESSHDEV